MRKVIVKWTYPRSLKSIYYSPEINNKGLYYITCRFGTHERSLYIGKTIRRFYDRILDHDSHWIHAYRGRKYVRFGIVEYPATCKSGEMNAIINSVESALIYEMRGSLVHNRMSINGYCVEHSCLIHNVGNRGAIPALVSMKEH